MKDKQPIGAQAKRAGTPANGAVEAKAQQGAAAFGKGATAGVSSHPGPARYCALLCPQGLQDRARTQSELGSASKRGFPHASLLKQPKPEGVASPCPRHADGAQESHQPQHAGGGGQPHKPAATGTSAERRAALRPALGGTYFSRLSCSSRQDNASGCSAKERTSSAQELTAAVAQRRASPMQGTAHLCI